MTRRIDELNALEEAEAEKTAQVPITVLDEDVPKVALLGALAWVHLKRTDPKLKYTDYMKDHNTRSIANYLFGSDEEDAERAAAEAAEAAPDEVAEVDDDPFPDSVAPAGDEDGALDPADAESPVLSGDGVLAGRL